MKLQHLLRSTSRLLFLACLLAGGRAPAAPLTFFTTHAAFNTAFPGLPVEDFEEGRLVGAAGEIINPPLSSASSNNVFRAGEIRPGMLFQDNPGPSVPGGLFLNRSGFRGVPSKTLSANSHADSLDIFFTLPALTAEMDLYAVDLVTMNVTYTLNLSIYGNGGLLGTRSLSARTDGVPVFFGVTAGEAITRINVDSTQDIAEFVDNVGFSPVPEPSALALLGGAGMALWTWLRRRGEQSSKLKVQSSR